MLSRQRDVLEFPSVYDPAFYLLYLLFNALLFPPGPGSDNDPLCQPGILALPFLLLLGIEAQFVLKLLNQAILGLSLVEYGRT